MKTAHSALLAVLLFALTAIPARAHHEVSVYDRDHPVVVRGVVREFIWANPHVILYVEVSNASSGADEWMLEGGSVPALAHSGWTRTSLRPGDGVEVLLAPRRDATHSGQILRVTASNGRVLTIGPLPGAR